MIYFTYTFIFYVEEYKLENLHSRLEKLEAVNVRLRSTNQMLRDSWISDALLRLAAENEGEPEISAAASIGMEYLNKYIRASISCKSELTERSLSSPRLIVEMEPNWLSEDKFPKKPFDFFGRLNVFNRQGALTEYARKLEVMTHYDDGMWETSVGFISPETERFSFLPIFGRDSFYIANHFTRIPAGRHDGSAVLRQFPFKIESYKREASPENTRHSVYLPGTKPSISSKSNLPPSPVRHSPGSSRFSTLSLSSLKTYSQLVEPTYSQPQSVTMSSDQYSPLFMGSVLTFVGYTVALVCKKKQK